MRMPYKVLVLVVATLVASAAAVKIENVREVSKDAQSITIEWSASSENQSQWLGFKIKYTRADASETRVVPLLVLNVADRRFRIDSLRPYTEYKIQVSAINRLHEEGPASNMITVRTNEAGDLLIELIDAIGDLFWDWGLFF